uniref:Xrn1 N-terminal domain-containing protein n=1 Tax=viral metagenome TaxID=1070528 RepID=A0A6C0BL71_9ZZZZ
MGIPNFYSAWIARHNRESGVRIITRDIPRNVASFSIDANGLIHTAAQKVYNYGESHNASRDAVIQKMDPALLRAEFFNEVTSNLLRIVRRTNPSDIVVIAVDGTAPRAKINQQRSRRFRSSKPSSDPSRVGPNKKIFDPNSITPGTEMMMALDTHIQNFLLTNRASFPSKLIYSSHLVPGEGEHKIMDFMRSGFYSDSVGAHLLYGLDADLVMLSLLAPISGIHLIRENLHDIVIIDQVAELVYRLMLRSKPTSDQEITVLRDFVLISFLIGNDFLPHQPSLEDVGISMDDLLGVYKDNYVDTGPLTTLDGGIIWYNFGQYLRLVSQYEPDLLKREATRSIQYPSPILKQSVYLTSPDEYGIDFDKYRNLWYAYIFNPRGQPDVAEALGVDLNVTLNDVRNMSYDYIIGLAWVFHYYQGNWQSVNVDWFYPHFYAPLITDVADTLLTSFLEGTEQEQISNVTTGDVAFEGFLPESPDQVSWNPIYQLLAVLPRSSANLLPQEVRALALPDSPIADMYPEDFIIDVNGKNKEHQGIALIPPPNMDRIIRAVFNTTTFTEDRAKLFEATSNIDYTDTTGSLDTIRNAERTREFLRQAQRGRGRGRGRGGRSFSNRSRDEQYSRGPRNDTTTQPDQPVRTLTAPALRSGRIVGPRTITY